MEFLLVDVQSLASGQALPSCRKTFVSIQTKVMIKQPTSLELFIAALWCLPARADTYVREIQAQKQVKRRLLLCDICCMSPHLLDRHCAFCLAQSRRRICHLFNDKEEGKKTSRLEPEFPSTWSQAVTGFLQNKTDTVTGRLGCRSLCLGNRLLRDEVTLLSEL